MRIVSKKPSWKHITFKTPKIGFSEWAKNGVTIRIKDDEYIFDLKNDISEETNIIDSSKPIYDRLKFQFKEWNKDMIDPVFLDLGSGKEYNKLNPDRWFISSQEKQ